MANNNKFLDDVRRSKDRIYFSFLEEIDTAEDLLEEATTKLYDFVVLQKILSSDANFIYPYLIVADYKLTYNQAINFSEKSFCFSFKQFINNDLKSLMRKFGSLICPLYYDDVLGVHNPLSFTDGNVNDLFEYWLETNKDFFNYIVSLEFSSLGLPKNVNRNEMGNLAKFPDVRRNLIIRYLKDAK